MNDEKRMIQNYEVKNAVHIGEKEIIFAEDTACERPYMCCDCRWDNPFSIDVYDNIVAGDDYLEIMDEWLNRLDEEIASIAEQRRERGVSNVPLTGSDCIEGSRYMGFKEQVVVMAPNNLTPSARTADHQLALATGGSGCNPNARGRAVFVTNLYTGKETRWERQDIAGIIQPERMPDWAQEKLEALGVKPSIEKQLKAKQEQVKVAQPKTAQPHMER